MLQVKRLQPGARLPAVAHPGEDLGYDLFALEETPLTARATVKVRTGIAVEARDPATRAPLGLLVRDRSSMAARGVATTGGVIDAGYRGEILVLMTNLGDAEITLAAGEKIAQMVPVPVLTGLVHEVDSLEDSRAGGEGLRQLRAVKTLYLIAAPRAKTNRPTPLEQRSLENTSKFPWEI